MSPHALLRCDEREVTPEQVAEIFDEPDDIQPNHRGVGVIYSKTFHVRGLFRKVELAIDDTVDPNVVKTVMITDKVR